MNQPSRSRATGQLGLLAAFSFSQQWGPGQGLHLIAFIWDMFFQVTSSINLESRNPTGIGSSRVLTPSAVQHGGGSSEARAWQSRASPGEHHPHPHTVPQVCSGEDCPKAFVHLQSTTQELVSSGPTQCEAGILGAP